MQESHPIAYRFAKLGLRLANPFIPRAKRALASYRQNKLQNLYNARAVMFNDYCYVNTELKYQPLISIVVPVYNPEPRHLSEMIYSVVNQHYSNWELILVNASSHLASRNIAADAVTIDSRINLIDLKDNKGISGNTNEGLKHAKGEYIAFGDHDDLLHPCALHSIVATLQVKDPPSFIYTDEDKISDYGTLYLNPHIKPDWSLDTIRNVNFVTHLMVIRKDLVDKVGGLRPATDGAQDYDLVLRVWDEHHPKIKHVQKILYHWRTAASSTAKQASVKDYIVTSGTRALQDHVKRNNLPAKASAIEGKPGYYQLEYDPVDYSVIVGPVSVGRRTAAVAWLSKLLSEQSAASELVIGEWFAKLKPDGLKLKLTYVKDDKHYWTEALAKASCKVSVCFRQAARPLKKNGLATLAAAAAAPEHSALAPMLVNESRIIVGGGVIEANGLSQVLFAGSQLGVYSWFLDTDWVRKTDDLTSQVIAGRTKDLKKLITQENYAGAQTLGAVMSKQARKEANLVVWSHSAFELMGPLAPKETVSYHSVGPFRFVPTYSVHIYDWWKEYDRDEA